MSSRDPTPEMPSFLSGGGEMGQRLRAHDWEAAGLGHPSTWPAALTTLVSVILGSNQPMFICWGPARTMLYNDAYGTILGIKHPAALGSDILDAWSEIRHDLAPLVEQVYAGEPVHMDDITLIMHRRGYPEETHFAFSYTPIRGEGGSISGLFCPCVEITEQVLAKRRMIEESERQRRLFEQAPGFIALLQGSDHIFDFANAAFVSLFGRRDNLGRSVREVYPELERQGLLQTLDEVYASGRRQIFNEAEVRFVDRPGLAERTMYLNFVYEPVLNEASEVTGIFIQGYDVTDFFRAQAALRASEQSFSALARSLPTMVWTAEANGRIDWLSEQAYQYAGAVPGTLIHDTWRQLVHPDDLPGLHAVWDSARETGTPLTHEFRLRRADGEYRWHLARGVPVRDSLGTLTRWVGSNTDIEDQKQTAEALSKRNSRLQQRVAQRTMERDRVWRNSRDLLAVIDRAGRYRSANPAWTDILGHLPEEVEELHCTELVHPEDAEATQLAIQQAFEARLTSFENRHLHRDGSERWISWHTSAEGNFCYAYGRDITAARRQAQALREAEEQLRHAQKMEAVGQLTGGIAHDFNNLLTGIIGSLELIVRRLEEGQLQSIERYARAGMQSAQRAAALTHRLLAFARRQPLAPAQVQAESLVEDMRELIQRTLGPQFRLQLRTQPDLWPTLCDPNQLESAILNLCINARDAMPDGGMLTIETSNTQREEDWPAGLGPTRTKDYVAIRIVDTGIGMAPQIIKRVIEPFFTTKPIGQGTGLGLSMVYGFAKQSEGHLDIDSTLGEGTRVTLLLPRYLGERPDVVAVLASREPRRQACATVLVVEDENQVRELVVEALRELGCVVMQASHGLSGRQQLHASSQIDLLITDIGLPGLGGRQLASAAREQHPDIKVLFITGYAQDPSFAEGLDTGQHELLTKPFLINDLKSRAMALLGSC